MTSYLRPMVALPAWSKTNHGYYGMPSLVRWRNRELFTASRTPYYRLWVAWPYLQPKNGSDPAANNVDRVPFQDAWNPNAPIDPANYDRHDLYGTTYYWPNMTPQLYLRQLDDTIIQARRAGLKVVLTLFLTPHWANGSRRSGFNSNPWYCPPDSAAPGSPWANIASYLATRYCSLTNDPRFGGYNGRWRWIDFLEVCNEPNGQWWPQDDASNDARNVPRLPELAAQMMKTARGITGAAGSPIILGPATSDGDNGTSYGTFTTRMLNWIRGANGFTEDGAIGWSHHNYKDIETPRTHTNSSTHQIRDQLAGRGWRGWGYDGSSNTVGQILLTEGGARRWVVNPTGDESQQNTSQSNALSAAWDRLMDGAADREGQNVASICNYLFWSTPAGRPNFDTGLCKFQEYWTEDPGMLGRDYKLAADASRPAFNMWKSKGTNAPRDTVVGYRQWYSLGGYCTSGPDACSLGTGHVEVFVVGGDAQLWHKWYSNGWSNWHPMGGHCTSDPTAVSMQGDRTDVFVRSTDNNIWWGWMSPNGQWNVYYPLGSPPGGAAGGPDVLSQAPGQLELFVRGNDGYLWHNWMYGYGGWSGWHPMGGPKVAYDPAAISWGNGRMDVFATDPSNTKLWWWWWQSDSGWHGPSEIPGPQMLEDSPERRDTMKTRPALIGGIDAASQEAGQLEVFVRGLDEYSDRGWVSNVWRMEYVPQYSGDWPFTGWEWIGAPFSAGQDFRNATSDPSGVSWHRNHTQVFVRGSDNGMWTMHQGFA